MSNAYASPETGRSRRDRRDLQTIYKYFIRRFRPQRIRFVAAHFDLTEDSTVLDVGGTMTNWNLLPFRPKLTLLNIDQKPDGLPDDVRYMRCDGCDMPFDDNSFDLVFSNSVIEHVGSWKRQSKFAQEIRRIGRAYYVQTPNYWFPVEPHFLTPFVHWLPIWLRKALVRNFTVWGWMTRPSQDHCNEFVENTRLLKRRDMMCLFPEADMVSEELLFQTKSIIALHRHE